MSKHGKRKLVCKCSKVWRDYGRFLSVLGCVSLVVLGALGLWVLRSEPKEIEEVPVELIPGGLPRPKGAAPVYDAEKAADHAAIFLLRFQRYNDFRKIDMTDLEFVNAFLRTDMAKSELSNKAVLEDLAGAWARYPSREAKQAKPDSAGYYWWFYRHTAGGRTNFLLLAEPATGLRADPWLFAYGNEMALLNGLRKELLRPLSEEDTEAVIRMLNTTEDNRLGTALVDFLAPKYARPKKQAPIEATLAQKTLRAFQRDLLNAERANAGKPLTVEQVDACWERNLPKGKEGEIMREKAVFTFTGSGSFARLHLALRREDGKSYAVLSSISLEPDGEPVEGGRNHILETVNHAFPVLGEPVVPKEVTQALQAGGEQEFEKVWEAVRAVCQEPAFADQWPASMVIHRRLRQQGMGQALEGKSWVLYPNDAGVIYLCRFPVANMNSKSAVGVKADLVAPLLAPKCQPVKPAEAEPGSVPLTLDVKNWEDNQPLSRN